MYNSVSPATLDVLMEKYRDTCLPFVSVGGKRSPVPKKETDFTYYKQLK